MKQRGSKNNRIILDVNKEENADDVQLLQPPGQNSAVRFPEDIGPVTQNRKMDERYNFSWRKAFEFDY